MSSGPASHFDPAASERIERHVWVVAGVVILGMIMSILDTTIVNVALRTLSADLHSSISHIQWVVTGYLLSLAAVIPVTGWAARRWGAKRVYLTSLVLFTIGSGLCAVASSTTSLVVFRVLQGAGGGMIMPVGQLIMAQVAGPRRMGRVMGIVSMPAMLAPILGPVVGGAILQNLHWSWIFLVNLPIGAVALLACWRLIPQTESGQAGRLDVLGLMLLSGASSSTVYGLAELGSHSNLTAPTVVWPIAAGLLLSAAFIWHALRAERPLLDVRLYTNRIFGAASLTTFGLGAALFGAMILVPLYYQEVRHESVIVTGLLTGPQGLGMLIVMPLAGRLSDRFGGGRVALAGVSVLALASLPLAFVDANTSIVVISLVLVLRGVGIGFAFMPAMTAAFASLRPHQLSDATPAAERAAADRRCDRHGGPGGRAGAGQRRLALVGPPRRRLRYGLLVVAGDRAALDRPLPGAAESRELPRPPQPGGRRGRGDRRAAGGLRPMGAPATTPAAPATVARREAQLTELGVAFRRVFRTLNRIRGRDTHLGGSELSHAQFVLLLELQEQGELSVGQLAGAARLSAGTVTQMLDGLVDSGRVERVRSPSDRRVAVCRLTPLGRRQTEAKRADWQRRWEQALEGFGERDLRAATKVLERLGSLFDDATPPGPPQARQNRV